MLAPIEVQRQFAPTAKRKHRRRGQQKSISDRHLGGNTPQLKGNGDPRGAPDQDAHGEELQIGGGHAAERTLK